LEETAHGEEEKHPCVSCSKFYLELPRRWGIRKILNSICYDSEHACQLNGTPRVKAWASVVGAQVVQICGANERGMYVGKGEGTT
jgi:hypothetical protein